MSSVPNRRLLAPVIAAVLALALLLPAAALAHDKGHSHHDKGHAHHGKGHGHGGHGKGPVANT
ncbi:MAG TPA: hypothetical protein VNR67_07555, partial [Solirubrobacterales bacterium]|nr:hypothetical protein [Solirubrobacterales bacterium]